MHSRMDMDSGAATLAGPEIKTRGGGRKDAVDFNTTPPAKQDDSAMFSNLFLLFFGSGTFAMPWGFARAGILGGILGVFAVAAVTYATIRMLIATKKSQLRRLSTLPGQSEGALQRSLSYAAIVSNAFGDPRARVIVKGATTFSSLGACGGYLTFVLGLMLPMVRVRCSSLSNTFLVFSIPHSRSAVSTG